ncbi:MAG: hypothetical protein ACXV2J_00415 [Actinomycetes bacterium]
MAPHGDDTTDDLVGGPPESPHRRTLAGSRWRVAGLLVAVAVAVVIAAPQLSLHAKAPAGQATRSPRPAPDEALGGAATRWTLRGDLATDDAFVAGALQRLSRDLPGRRHALFAGRLPDGSRLLLAASDVAPDVAASAVTALHVAAGQAPRTGTVSPVAALTDPAQVLGWATVGRDGRVYVLALGPPRPLRLEVSARVTFGADAVGRRRWLTQMSQNGVVLTDVGTRTDPAVAVRSLGPAPYVTPVLIPVAGRAVTPPAGLVVGGVDAAGYRGPEPRLLAQGLVAMTEDLLDLGTAPARVLWSGAPWQGRRLALVLITRRDGTRFQAVVGQQGASWFPAGVRPLPAAEPAVVPWLLEPFSSADPTMLLCPTGPGSLDYLRRGRPARRIPIRSDSVAMLEEPSNMPPHPGGALVRLRDRTGRVVLTTRLPLAGFDDALAVSRR